MVSRFPRTCVNFQRAPTVDTPSPFSAPDIPGADESLAVTRFADPRGMDPCLTSMIPGLLDRKRTA